MLYCISQHGKHRYGERKISHVKHYVVSLAKAWARGDATEHTHRAALAQLIGSSLPGLDATNEPKATQRENKPDYLVRKHNTLVGYVEAKDLNADLSSVLKSAQIKRYQEALPNLLVTNYLDFAWLLGPERRMTISLGTLCGKAIDLHPDADARWNELIRSFCDEVTPTLGTPHQLAASLAGQTRLLRDLVAELLGTGDEALQAQYAAFKSLLMPNLQAEEFGDMYAQTAVYGLFTARVFESTSLYGAAPEKLPAHLRKGAFNLEKAGFLIPRANPFLRQFFHHVASPDLSEQLRWLIEQVAFSLRYTDMDKVLHRQSRKQGFEDPVFHFYETFLGAYNQKLREQRGVYYTPQPVVDFMVRSVDTLLKIELGKPDGLADKDTLILDPATGTATFLRRVIDQIHQHVTRHGNDGLWPQYVKERLLPRIFGFELMMAPYTVAHLKLALQLQEQGYAFGKRTGTQGDERLNVYLTNTLDMISKSTDQFMANWIAAENLGAEEVKRSAPVQVVLGNPPYSGISLNNSAMIRQLIDEYKQEPDGGPLQERKHWLNDDYVKFIRFAHDRIVRTGHGMVAFITNHGWLDNPTFRGMRASLMRDFDQIYVLDLHGNAKKKERTPSTLSAQGDDKNVFDIEQGVAITVLIKRRDPNAITAGDLFGDVLPAKAPAVGLAPRKAVVHHADLWGGREHKYHYLQTAKWNEVAWTTLSPQSPLLLFVPLSEEGRERYESGWKVTSIFPVNTTGIVTARDGLALDFDAAALAAKVKAFLNNEHTDEEVRLSTFGRSLPSAKYPAGDSRGWKLGRARNELRLKNWEKSITQCLYRPFDRRAILYEKSMVDWGRWDVMRHLVAKKNFALVSAKQSKGDWGNFVTDTVGGHKACVAYDINTFFPLWLHPPGKPPQPNISPSFLHALSENLGLPHETERHDLPQGVEPEDVLAYVYAVLHAPDYRSRYAEFLKSDFPRIPLGVVSGSAQTFAQVWQALLPLGRTLIDLHLLRQVPPALRPRFPVAGDNTVEKPRREAATDRVYINATQYFAGVPQATWEFKVGGYQVCEKWLKDRKGRTLTLEDVEHYQNTVAALSQTRSVMVQIDALATAVLWPGMTSAG